MKNQNSDNFDFRTITTHNKLLGLWKVMTGYHKYYIWAISALTISSLAKTAALFVLREFADIVSADSPVWWNGSMTFTFTMISLMFLGFSIIEGVFAYVSGRSSAYTAENVARRLRNFMFDQIQRLSFSYHNQTPTGDLIERVTSDLDTVRRFFSEQLIGMGRILLLFFINWGAILSINVKLGLLSVVVIPPILIISYWFFTRVTKAFEAYQIQEAKLSTTLQENLNGVRVVKAFARQNYEKDKFETENFQKFLKGKFLLLMHSLFWPLSDIVLGFQMLAGFLIAGNLVIDGTITIGSYLAYAGLVVWLIWPIRNLGRLIVQTSQGLVSYSRLMQVINEPREDLEVGSFPYESVKGHIVFDNVGFQYSDGNTEVLKNISFEIKPGQSLALIGSTGSGKTTLINLLPRFHEYTSGSITVDGIELRQIPKRFLRSQIGIVEQEPFLFSRSIRENIRFGVDKDVNEDEIIHAAKIAKLHDVIEKFQEGYDTIVGEKGVTLSGGQKQRATIARTVIKNPRILILDDSTSSVDTETEAQIREELNELMKGRTTFIIAHRIQSVINADMILVLKDGQIIQKGAHAELLKDESGIYKRIFDLQTKMDEQLEADLSL
ncbi:MAG TPA: ABC transporter ATP-binding protein [Anaerolineales bacterium]|nr:ABC transporter ATP-binding protein [Anaerolineales bacterium]